MFSEIYDVAVKTAMGIDLDEKAAAVSVFLITWNNVWYTVNPQGKEASKDLEKHFSDLKKAISSTVTKIALFTGKDLMDVDLNDENVEFTIKACFDTFKRVCGSTGASKALHILNPNLFIMWGRKIREAYGVEDDSNWYLKSLHKVKSILENVIQEYAYDNDLSMDKARETLRQKLGVSLIKALDEYNYLKYTEKESPPSIHGEAFAHLKTLPP